MEITNFFHAVESHSLKLFIYKKIWNIYLFSFVPKVEGFYPAVMSEDMVQDGYEEIMNIDISSVVIEMMRKKYANAPQLQCILFYQKILFFQFLNHMLTIQKI